MQLKGHSGSIGQNSSQYLPGWRHVLPFPFSSFLFFAARYLIIFFTSRQGERNAPQYRKNITDSAIAGWKNYKTNIPRKRRANVGILQCG